MRRLLTRRCDGIAGTAALTLLLTAPLACPAAAQAPTFASRVEAVRVDVLVTNNGQPVRGLGPDDFEVFDNGVRQHVDFVSFEQLPLNVVLVFDMSDSVVGERLVHLRAAGRTLLDSLRDADHAAFVSFNHAVSIGAPLTAVRGAVREALAAASPSGDTSLIDAAYVGLTVGESDVGRSLVMVFSDGMDTTSWLSAASVLDVARRCDAVVYAVSVGLTRRGDFLESVAEQTGGRRFQMESTRDLGTVFLQMLNEFRQRYLISYSPTGVGTSGWHALTVVAKNRGLTVKARPGYQAGR
jgi:VWFA-related protein